MISVKQVWEQILKEIEKKMSALPFDLFISTLEPICIYKEKTLVLLVSTEANLNIIQKRHATAIKEATKKAYPSINDVQYILNDEVSMYEKFRDAMQEAPTFFDEQNQDCVNFYRAYTFDNYVVGKSNEYASAVARAVAEKPGSKYNPLFIYGGVGLGKTHLMHAIGNYYTQNNKNLKVAYVSAEKFTNDLIESFRDKCDIDAKKDFRNKYRNLDCLMIDDIQFIAKTNSTQEEIFHTFNDLYLAGKQIIISSDRPPKEIALLEERLRTRFESGVLADIAQPDLEMRIAILQRMCATENVNINNEVLQIIAERVTNNVRDLKGLLTKVLSYAPLIGRDYNDTEVVLSALKDYSNDKNEVITLERIIEEICNYYGVKEAELVGKKKNKEIVMPRQVAIYLVTEFLTMPLTAIGEYFGGRDHTTIMYARDKISSSIKENASIEKQVKDVKDLILKR
ncbi:MAG: chromosomal replication initiator protein DnaA [Clostridia bacterium]